MNLPYLETIEFHGYTVREDGLVTRREDDLVIRPSYVINRGGRRYPTYRLTYEGDRHKWFAHRLMAWLFLAQGTIELWEFKLMIVDHLDNDPSNYAAWNLEILQGHGENLRRRREEFSEIPF